MMNSGMGVWNRQSSCLVLLFPSIFFFWPCCPLPSPLCPVLSGFSLSFFLLSVRSGYDQYGGYDEQYEYDYQPEDVDYYEPQQQQQQQQEQQKEGSPGRLTAGDLDGTSA